MKKLNFLATAFFGLFLITNAIAGETHSPGRSEEPPPDPSASTQTMTVINIVQTIVNLIP